MNEKEKQQRIFWGVFVVACIAFVLGLALLNPSGETNPIAEDIAPTKDIAITIGENERTLGNAEAQITLVEYADLECPACAGYHEIIKEVVDTYGDDIQYAYRHFPLTSIHPHAMAAAIAAEAAGEQDKFWEMQDHLLANQSEWAVMNDPNAQFVLYADELGLDREQFMADLGRADLADKVTAQREEALAFGLTGTPSFILDNKVIERVPGTVEGFGDLIEQRKILLELHAEDSEE